MLGRHSQTFTQMTAHLIKDDVCLVEWIPNISPMEIMYSSKQVRANCICIRRANSALNLTVGTSKKQNNAISTDPHKLNNYVYNSHKM